MRRIFVTFVFLVSLLHASEKEFSTKIIENIVDVIDDRYTPVWIDPESRNIDKFLAKERLNRVGSCEKASILIMTHERDIPETCRKKPIVVLDYALLKKYETALAAFFWKKGRPNIVFVDERIRSFNVSLPQSYEIYVEEELW